jgi:NAD(P)-dependent dehydrogenase (short-subunit alcohol dehydrogenase family)
MSDTLMNRIAIVTGGARGIGFAVAQTLAMEGAKVVIADNGCAIDGGPEDSVAADAAVERLNAKAPGCAIAFDENLADAGAAERCVQATLDAFGAVDIVINNAAIERHGAIQSLKIDDFEQVLRNNLLAPAALLAAATPRMVTQESSGRLPGAIVNLVGAAGFIGNPRQSAISAAKAGLIALTRTAAMDLSRHGIICNAVAPWATTRVTQAMQPVNEVQREYKANSLALPMSYVANLVVYLCTSYAARVSGQLFGVRGREVLLFHPAAPEMTIFTQPGGFDADQYAQWMQSLRGKLADMRSEYEIFNIDPIL